MDKPVPFVMPDVEALKKYVDEARVKALLDLIARVESGAATAAELTALMRAANEVEAMIPDHVKVRAEQTASECLADDFVAPFGPDDSYDPDAPLSDLH